MSTICLTVLGGSRRRYPSSAWRIDLSLPGVCIEIVCDAEFENACSPGPHATEAHEMDIFTNCQRS